VVTDWKGEKETIKVGGGRTRSQHLVDLGFPDRKKMLVSRRRPSNQREGGVEVGGDSSPREKERKSQNAMSGGFCLEVRTRFWRKNEAYIAGTKLQKRTSDTQAAGQVTFGKGKRVNWGVGQKLR